jgi:hypothetical protein
MQMNLLKAGASVTTRFLITQDRARHWRHAATNAPVGGGIMPGTSLTVAAVQMNPPAVKLELPGRSPPAFLVLTGEELAGCFDMVAPPTGSPAPAANLATVFQKLSQRQMAVSAGVGALRDARAALKKDTADAMFWGNIAVFANAAMLPLNVMLNAFEVNGAVSIYKTVVKELYGKLGKSGTRMQGGAVKTSLSVIKKAPVEALKSKGLTQWVPGVNIIVGFAEDSVALFEAASMVADGSAEMRNLMRQLDAKLADAERAYLRLGIEMDRVLTEIQRRQRTA